MEENARQCLEGHTIHASTNALRQTEKQDSGHNGPGGARPSKGAGACAHLRSCVPYRTRN